jgi:hypothetical protein
VILNWAPFTKLAYTEVLFILKIGNFSKIHLKIGNKVLFEICGRVSKKFYISSKTIPKNECPLIRVLINRREKY